MFACVSRLSIACRESTSGTTGGRGDMTAGGLGSRYCDAVLTVGCISKYVTMEQLNRKSEDSSFEFSSISYTHSLSHHSTFLSFVFIPFSYRLFISFTTESLVHNLLDHIRFYY